MFEVRSKEELPLIKPPAVAYVRTEDDYYWCFEDGWRKVDNAFLSENASSFAMDCYFEMMDEDITYRDMILYHYGYRNAPVINPSTLTGKVAKIGQRLCCIQNQLINDICIKDNMYLLDTAITKLGIPVLEENTPGIHIQDRAKREYFKKWHPEPIGFVVCNGASKGATRITCNVCPESVATKLNSPCKQVAFTEPGNTPSVCAGGVAPSNLPWGYTNEMWLTGPWEYVDIHASASGLSGGEWPSGLATTISFSDPIPMPLFEGSCVFMDENDWFVPPVKPGFGFVAIGDYGKTIGKTSISARVDPGPSEQTLWVHYPGDTTIKMFQPWWMIRDAKRHSNIRGLKEGDIVCFEKGTNQPVDRTLYTVWDVTSNPAENPSEFKINPPLKVGLYDSAPSHYTQYYLGQNCYWIPARGELTCRFFGWEDPFGFTGVPIYIKEIRGKTLELLSPLPDDIPKNTKMYMWSSVDNETMTYAYHDPYSYAYTRAWASNYDRIADDIIAWNASKDEEERYYRRMWQKAMEVGHSLWYSPPYFVNYDLNESYSGPDGSFHATFKRITESRISLRQPRQDDVEYLSLLNYRSLL